MQRAVLEIRDLHQKLGDTRTAAAKKSNASDITQAADALEQKASLVEDKLVQRRAIAHEDPLNFPIQLNNLLASLGLTVSHGSGAPTKQAYEEFDALKTTATQYLQEWDRIKTTDLAAFNKLIQGSRLASISVTAKVAFVPRAMHEAVAAEEGSDLEDDE